MLHPRPWAVTASPVFSSFFLLVIKCSPLALLSNSSTASCPSQSARPIFHASDFRLTESSIHYPWPSRQILLNITSYSLSMTNFPKFSSAAMNLVRISTAQLSQWSPFKPKMSQKANKLSKCKLATHSCAQSSCTDHFLQFKLPKNTATGCFHSLLLFSTHLSSCIFQFLSISKSTCVGAQPACSSPPALIQKNSTHFSFVIIDIWCYILKILLCISLPVPLVLEDNLVTPAEKSPCLLPSNYYFKNCTHIKNPNDGITAGSVAGYQNRNVKVILNELIWKIIWGRRAQE